MYCCNMAETCPQFTLQIWISCEALLHRKHQKQLSWDASLRPHLKYLQAYAAAACVLHVPHPDTSLSVSLSLSLSLSIPFSFSLSLCRHHKSCPLVWAQHTQPRLDTCTPNERAHSCTHTHAIAPAQTHTYTHTHTQGRVRQPTKKRAEHEGSSPSPPPSKKPRKRLYVSAHGGKDSAEGQGTPDAAE